MELFGWLFGTREVPGRAQAEFDHPKIYGEVESGPGVAAASRAAANWRERVSTAFADADGNLDRVLKKFDVVLQGAAGQQAKEAVTPLSQATRQSIEVAAQVGAAVQQQAQGSADFKNAFPPPHQVPPDNIGWADYVNPISYGAKTGVRAAHEELHDKVETQAREQYESYTQASNDRANTVQRFDPPPKFTADVSSAPTTPAGKVNPGTGYTGTSDTASGTSSPRTSSGSVDPTGSAPSAGQSSVSPTPQSPAQSSAAWATPPAAGPAPAPTAGAPTPGPGGGGFVGGAVVPPGGTGTPGVGGRAGGGGAGTGVGRGGVGGAPGVGRGVGGGRVLGPGGSSGVGGSVPGGGSATGGAAARGGPGGVAGGAAPAGRGQRDEDDKEHTNKYAEPTTEAWQELGLPKVAPPVFGDWDAQEQEGKPPRPPEKGTS